MYCIRDVHMVCAVCAYRFRVKNPAIVSNGIALRLSYRSV